MNIRKTCNITTRTLQGYEYQWVERVVHSYNNLQHLQHFGRAAQLSSNTMRCYNVSQRKHIETKPMTAILFDTLELATKLKAVGFTEEQARTITSVQQEVSAHTLEQARHDYHLDEVTTRRDLKELETALKHDVKELETSLKHDIELLRAETKRDIAETKAELIRWIVGVGLLQTSLIIGALMKMTRLI